MPSYPTQGKPSSSKAVSEATHGGKETGAVRAGWGGGVGRGMMLLLGPQNRAEAWTLQQHDPISSLCSSSSPKLGHFTPEGCQLMTCKTLNTH